MEAAILAMFAIIEVIVIGLLTAIAWLMTKGD
jgi:hypothetical protein